MCSCCAWRCVGGSQHTGAHLCAGNACRAADREGTEQALHGFMYVLRQESKLAVCREPCTQCGRPCNWVIGHQGRTKTEEHRCFQHCLDRLRPDPDEPVHTQQPLPPLVAVKYEAAASSGSDTPTIAEAPGYRTPPAVVTRRCAGCGGAHATLTEFGECTDQRAKQYGLTAAATCASVGVAVLLLAARVLGWF